MSRPKVEKPLTEAQLTVLLAERFAAPEYAFLPQVRNGTGWSRRTTRTADALAMSLWPSRGLELIGFELKSDRADWLREKADPAKAEEIGQFCDRWWVVVGAETVVQQDDLFPPTWGLMVAGKGKLRVIREAPKLEARPLDRAQLAAILRRAAECVVPRAEIRAQIERAEAQATERLAERVRIETLHLRHDLEALRARVEEFEQESGLDLTPWRLGQVAKAARFIADGGLEAQRAGLEALHARAREIADTLAEQLGAPAARTGTEG